MTEPTPLDAAHAAMDIAPDDPAPRLRFYERLADGELFLLLEAEPEPGAGSEDAKLAPRVFALEDGPVVLVFDREARLAAFAGGSAPYAALPGRVVAGQLAGQGVGLGVNLGVAPSSMLLPPEAVDWLARTLSRGPERADARPVSFAPPAGLTPALIAALDAKLARAVGLAGWAGLAAVKYDDGHSGHLLAFVATAAGAEDVLARAVAEAVVFSGPDEGALDVAFLAADDPTAAILARAALRFDLAAPEPKAAAAPSAPGSDPARPPILR